MAEEFLYISLQPLALCNGRFSNPPDLPSFPSGHPVWRLPQPWDLVTDLRTFVQIHDRYSEFRLEMELCLDRIQPVDTWTAFLGVSVHEFYLQILTLRTSGTTKFGQKPRVKFDISQRMRSRSIRRDFDQDITQSKGSFQ